MRRIADEQGLVTIGTLGLLAAAVNHGHLSAADALHDLDLAVSRHGFRSPLPALPPRAGCLICPPLRLQLGDC
jgi:predicted nucleic acid-binding protein